MNKVFADEKRVFLDNWNAAYGNKILHVLFLIHFAHLNNKFPVMYKNSNLDDIFNFNFETLDIGQLTIKDYFFIEKDSFYIQNEFLKKLGLYYKFFNKNLNSVIVKHYEHFLERKNLLLHTALPDEDFKIRGHFFDYELMPSYEIFQKYISIRPDLIVTIKEKYANIEHENHIAVHYRGTDFSTHLNHLFPNGIHIDKDYYIKSINVIESNLGKDVTYHLFSDDIQFLKNIFNGRKIIVHDDSASLDWVAMFLMKNIIQSNSSFCWTASLYNKNISIQPQDGYNYHQGNGPIPYGFHHKNSILIPKNKVKLL